MSFADESFEAEVETAMGQTIRLPPGAETAESTVRSIMRSSLGL